MRSVVVGLGVNVDWPASDFPEELVPVMGSLSEAAGTPVDRDVLLAGWLARMVSAYLALAAGEFDVGRWAEAQVTTGAQVLVQTSSRQLEGRAEGVDPGSGALLLREAAGGSLHQVTAGEVLRCSIVHPAPTL
jgi:BirA family biotin operon repressor/biotin-[acetyl-CoA-carboxylase] ligase